MALYKVYFKVGFSHSARTMNLDYPSESAAKETLIRQCTVPATKASELVIERIERV
ncbi:MAG: hypothetical protein J6Q60_06280 [Bacteroidaceae bacterium]|nr:hypothetical protein [Bacteroidaceae bacterium]